MVAVLFLSACGGTEEPEPARVTAALQCDETLSPEAARALESVLGTKRFRPAGSGGLERVAGELAEDYTKFPRWTQGRSLCRVDHPGNTDGIRITVRLRREEGRLWDRHAADLHPYAMGAEALAGPQGARLVVSCVSPQFQGSDKRPARMQSSLTFRRSELPDTVPIREANLTILHSATLAVVRKLGCAEDAGLEAEPVFKALPE
ncbi:hypothetical protein [Streptomyces sp. NPDC057854]|uniref:hypothetical protein n=1 Tax=unclassified Streptomyces TaxID=2593676 RepID=UPI0036750AE0